MELQILPLDPAQTRTAPTLDFGFGATFANRMFVQRYTKEEGWGDARIEPYGPLPLDPATAVLHYGQEIFEGLKAYRRPDGDINLFRPWENMRRFNNSARRMAMPVVDEEEHLAAIVKLVELEEAWVPSVEGSSLYIRPFMFSTDPALGVRASNTYLHAVIVGPVGAYFKGGFAPVPVYITDEYVRAVPGGVGEAKTGGNYAASLYAGEVAREKGYSQVLWLDGKEHRYVEEVGAMNICFVYDGERIVTPPLTGSILPGVTRKSVIELGHDLGYAVAEEPVEVNQMVADIRSGHITEVFGCGTAAVIAPVGVFGFHDQTIEINNNEAGPVARRLYDELTAIQFGRVPDRFGWTHRIAVD